MHRTTSKPRARRRIAGAVLGSLLAIATVAALPTNPASATTGGVSRTPWQMHIDPSPHGYIGAIGFHGNPAAYIHANVPAENAGSWQTAPDPDIIGFDGRVPGYGGGGASRLGPWVCLTAVDFTYFQTFVTVPVGTTVDSFTVDFRGIDDGARISVYNSANPGGLVIPGSYVFLGGSGTTNLASYLVTGTNRVVITQMDDCASGNNLSEATIVVNDTVVPPNTPPTVAVTGVGAAAYEIGQEPTPGCSAADAQDGSSSPTPTVSALAGPQAVVGLGTRTVTCSVTDAGGLSASASQSYAVVDTIDPTLSGTPTTGPNVNGWYAGPVTIAWTAGDVGTGIAATPADSVITGDGTGLTASASVSDLAGNSASAVSAPAVDIDSVAPTASPTADATGWSNDDVTVDWGWADGLSGTDGCDVSSSSTGEGEDIVLSSTCTDLAGNAATATATVDVDKTDPEITFSGATSYGLLETVAIECEADDDLSGLATSSCDEASGPAYSFGPGTHDLDASATDVAGNESSASTSFTVTATGSSVCGLVGVFTTHNGTRTSLCAHIANFERSRAKGQTGPAAVQLEAFRKEATSRIGKQLTAPEVFHLVSWANAL